MVPKPCLIIDTREKSPWDFEGDDKFEDIIHRKLDTGDYSIEGCEHLISIERKASADELFSNFCDKNSKVRIYKEMDRLKEIPYRFIIIECSLDELATPNSYYINKTGKNRQSLYMPVVVVLNNLTKLMIDYNIHVVFAGFKGKSIAKRILIDFFNSHRKGRLNVDNSNKDEAET